jgi:pimeloyl-ACP methyl ester carboxylesterase
VALVEALLTEVHPDTRFVLAGHSVGAHICLELMRRVPALSERCDRALLLFPTIMHIGSTPNGRALRPVFHPLVRHAVAVVAGFLALLPRRFVGPLLAWHVGHEHDGILSGCSLLLSANATHNALFMAYHEMREILALDHSTISRHVDKLLFYFGSGDRWCPPEYAKAIMAAYPRAHAILCSEGIKHAFVLGGAEAMALKAWGWIEALARRRS